MMHQRRSSCRARGARGWLLGLLAGCAVVASAGSTFALDAGVAASAGGGAKAKGLRDGGAVDGAAAVGNARTDAAPAAVGLAGDTDDGQDEGDDELPAGHPRVGAGDSDDNANNPHAGAAGAPRAGARGGPQPPAMFRPPEDVEQPDSAAPPGTITVDLQDADGKPLPNEMLTLGILINSIAKGDNRKHLQGTTNEQGRVVFSGLETASNIAYRVSSGYQGGSFGAMPFQLQQAKAMHVVLHVYAVTHDVQKALIACSIVVAAEMKDDRIQIEEALTVTNIGRVAWQPDNVFLTLPDSATAFNAQASMSDQGVESATQDGHLLGRLHGTFPPGNSQIEFRWQLPWSDDPDVEFDVGTPPKVMSARVLMQATSEVKLTAEGFPPTQSVKNSQGQSFLLTERNLMQERMSQGTDPKLPSISVGLHDLPTRGPGRWIATFLAACGVSVGLVFAFAGKPTKPGRGEAKANRNAVLEELAELERARATGDVGPVTYERSRRELLSALARVMSTGT